MAQPLIFISYHQQDEQEKAQLLAHLRVPQSVGLFDVWSDSPPGAEMEIEVGQAIAQSKVAILLVTTHFLGWDFAQETIVPQLLNRQRSGELTIFPILAKPCLWQSVPWLKQMNIRPHTRQPVWSDPDHPPDHHLALIAGEIADLISPTPIDSSPPQTPPLNPFHTGGRINRPDHFFGRGRLVREIRSELKKRASVSLVGPSQIGKSSLLYYLYLTRAGWLPEVTLEYIDLQGVLDEEDFCETVLQKLGGDGHTLRQLKRTLVGRDVVLLFDEMERLAEEDFNPRLHDLLRSLAQEPHFAIGLATQRPLLEVFPARTPGGVSPFHNIFTAKTIGPFTQAEARAFLADRLANTGLTFTEAEIERLLTQSQGHPAKLQAMAKALFAEKVDQV